MKLFGPKAKLTELANLIMAEDIEALEIKFQQGLNINAKFHICEYIDETPIILSLCENKTKVIHWLLSKKVELNKKGNPAILMACSNCNIEIIQLLIDNGANLNAKHAIGKNAMNDALYGNNYDAISFLLDNGYDIKKDGVSLRQAIMNKQYKAIKIFLDHGVDVNFSKPDMVFPYNSTPVQIATENNDFDTVKLLVEHGADVTIKDHYGKRPYNCAVENKNEEMTEFIKSLEPKEWHDEEKRLISLKSYKIPSELLEILRRTDRKIELSGNKYVNYITFSSLLNVKEVNWKKHKFLDLLSDADNYGCEGFLVWFPKNQCFAFADYEHEEFKELCSVEDFIKNPSKQINKIFKS